MTPTELSLARDLIVRARLARARTIVEDAHEIRRQQTRPRRFKCGYCGVYTRAGRVACPDHEAIADVDPHYAEVD